MPGTATKTFLLGLGDQTGFQSLRHRTGHHRWAQFFAPFGKRIATAYVWALARLSLETPSKKAWINGGATPRPITCVIAVPGVVTRPHPRMGRTNSRDRRPIARGREAARPRRGPRGSRRRDRAHARDDHGPPTDHPQLLASFPLVLWLSRRSGCQDMGDAFGPGVDLRAVPEAAVTAPVP